MKRSLLALLGVAASSWPRRRSAQDSGRPRRRRRPRPPADEDGEAARRWWWSTRLQGRDEAHQRARHDERDRRRHASPAQPAQNYGDLLRSVPGLNVIQTSARDINITTRQATSTLANSQLVLLDGRSIYLDFFGLVLWDFVPADPDEIKQIEVVRGPASVVWGANALTGVVNIITKTPREAPRASASSLTRRPPQPRRGLARGRRRRATSSAPTSRTPRRPTTPRRTGSPPATSTRTRTRAPRAVPLDCHPLGISPCRSASGSLPAASDRRRQLPGGREPAGAFENQGTSQPKFDLRLDQDLDERRPHDLPGRLRGHRGHRPHRHRPVRHPERLLHGLRPRRVREGRAASIAGFGNFLDAEAPNLLSADPARCGPIQLDFKTQTYDLEVGNTNVLGGQAHPHLRRQRAAEQLRHLDRAAADDRTEFGAYLQEEYLPRQVPLRAGRRASTSSATSRTRCSRRA